MPFILVMSIVLSFSLHFRWTRQTSPLSWSTQPNSPVASPGGDLAIIDPEQIHRKSSVQLRGPPTTFVEASTCVFSILAHQIIVINESVSGPEKTAVGVPKDDVVVRVWKVVYKPYLSRWLSVERLYRSDLESSIANIAS